MLENCKNFDKDVRFTGASDLALAMIRNLQPFEETIERRIVQAYTAHLKDASIEVKGNAVKCIKDTAHLLRESNITFIVETLAAEIVNTDDVECIELFSLACQNLV
jgi:hypothetical protein